MKALFQIGPSEACVSEVSISIWSFWKRKNFPKNGREFLGKIRDQMEKTDFLMQSMVKMSRLEAGILQIP